MVCKHLVDSVWEKSLGNISFKDFQLSGYKEARFPLSSRSSPLSKVRNKKFGSA